MADDEIKQEIEESGDSVGAKSRVIKSRYEQYEEGLKNLNFEGPRSTKELVEFLQKNPKVEIDARVIAVSESDKKRGIKQMQRAEFLKSWTESETSAGVKSVTAKMREGSVDYFGTDAYPWAGNIVGSPDYIPLMGGPFYKQQYYYDYIKGHQQAYYAFHHDPVANTIIQMTRDFTLGRDWKVSIDNPAAEALWEAFCEVNNFHDMMDFIAIELAGYGEEMIWWLPNNDTKIVYNLSKGQEPPKGAIPRIRLIDPSCIWDIVTYPEDITRVLFYQWVAPTQYQTYTGRDGGSQVPSSKFIFQQIPADQVDHYKINTVSNEKRGRSDLFPILEYLKRLRDSVNYSIISMQKQTAWSIDTSIDGSPEQIDEYVREQNKVGSIPPAGSEFVHSAKVTRTYLANEGGARGGNNPAFEWALSMIAAGSGFPIQYFGTHLSNSQTRAGALVATEPVVKKLEMRQQVYRKIIKNTAKRLFEKFGLPKDIKVEVIFPEIAGSDRSAKLKDLMMAESRGWISKETAATIAAKELQISEYVFEEEMEKLEKDLDTARLTTPGEIDPKTGKEIGKEDEKARGEDGKDRRDLPINKSL